MIAFLTVLLMTAASLGAGTAILRFTTGLEDFPPLERLTLGFTLGVGLLGWLMFFPVWGHGLDLPILLAIPAVCLLGWRWVLPAIRTFDPSVPGALGKVLLAGIIVVLGLDFMEALSPPGDADTLAYHFATPKTILAAGGLEVIYRAGDGLAPMLQHMTYLLAMALGGEFAATLWTMITGWGLAALAFAVSRRHLSLNWSMAVAFVLLTTPAVIYGAGTGQVEVRNAMFALAAAVFVAHALKTGRLDFAAVAGLAAGFYMGSKYPGLLLAFSCGLFILFQRRWFSAGAVFSLLCLAAGGQWYVWNWWVTGDPIFPMLYGIVPYGEHVPWNDAVNAAYLQMRHDRELPATLFWFFAYPIKATLDPLRYFGSLRVGFGPALLLLLPFAVLTLWRHWGKAIRSPLAIYAGIALSVYGLWFFLGPSLRVRHLLPLYPLALIVMMVAATKSYQYLAMARAPLIAALAAVMLMQLAGHTFFALNHMERLVNRETRDAFLRRNVRLYDIVAWVNENLEKTDRLLLTERQFTYLADSPVFYGLGAPQAVIEMHPGARNIGRFWKQLREQGISHVLTPEPQVGQPFSLPFVFLVNGLMEKGCATIRKSFELREISSRALQSFSEKSVKFQIVQLNRTCDLTGTGR